MNKLDQIFNTAVCSMNKSLHTDNCGTNPVIVFQDESVAREGCDLLIPSKFTNKPNDVSLRIYQEFTDLDMAFYNIKHNKWRGKFYDPTVDILHKLTNISLKISKNIFLERNLQSGTK